MTESMKKTDDGNYISTHILTKRMTAIYNTLKNSNIFQLTSSRRGWHHRRCRRFWWSRHFNSHPHEEDDSISLKILLPDNYFNSHPHEEDDHNRSSVFIIISYFNSHPHEEDDDGARNWHWQYLKFQLTSSRRGWRQGIRISRKIHTFQLTSSRRGWPHHQFISSDLKISTHILTKRMTLEARQFLLFFDISTHILTKRMTITFQRGESNGRNFNSHPHEEDDVWKPANFYYFLIFQLTSSRRGWQFFRRLHLHWQIFQLTSSRRGWHRELAVYDTTRAISTHILTKRMTLIKLYWGPSQIFQLTSSRRGWLTVWHCLR